MVTDKECWLYVGCGKVSCFTNVSTSLEMELGLHFLVKGGEKGGKVGNQLFVSFLVSFAPRCRGLVLVEQ